MFHWLQEFWRRACGMAIPQATCHMPLATIEVRAAPGQIITVVYERGDHVWVWRYQTWRDEPASRLPGILAARGGEFNWHDAAVVTAAMRGERACRESDRASTV